MLRANNGIALFSQMRRLVIVGSGRELTGCRVAIGAPTRDLSNEVGQRG